MDELLRIFGYRFHAAELNLLELYGKVIALNANGSIRYWKVDCLGKIYHFSTPGIEQSALN